MAKDASNKSNSPDPDIDWRRVALNTLISRALDHLEESQLVPAKKVLYQFSARNTRPPPAGRRRSNTGAPC